jgi:hypothetical protein
VGRLNKADVFIEIRYVVDMVRSQGGRVLLVGVSPGKDWRTLTDGVGLRQEDFSYFKSRKEWTVCGEEIRELY